MTGQPPTPRTPSPWPGPLAAGYVALAGLLIALTVLTGQGATWLAEQVAITSGTARPSWPVTGLISAAIALLLALPALFFQRWPRLRAAGVAWMRGAVLLAVLGGLRLIPSAQNELYLATLALTTGVVAVLPWLIRHRHAREAVVAALPTYDRPGAAAWLGAAAGLATLLPWLWIGALGGLLETLLAGLAAAGFGALAGTVLGVPLWGWYSSLPRWKLVLGGGYVAGVTLTLLTGSLGGGGVQLPALLAIPGLGFAAAALQRRDSPPSGLAVGTLVGVAAFGPLGFADPEEVSVLLEFYWPLLAGLAALAIAYGFGAGYAVLPRTAVRARVAALVTAAVALAGIGVYASAGQPGLHGERLFVVLRSQADLSGVDVRAGRNARTAAVYRRLVRYAEQTQRPLRRELDRLGLAHTPYYLVNAISVRGGPAVREWLSRRADIDRVLLDPVLRPIPGNPAGLPLPSVPAPREPDWNLEMVGAPRAWDEFGATGKGIVVGGSDSGVDGGHPALREGFRGGGDSWYDPWNQTRTPTDFGGHGTHTLASAVGGENVGVAPDAQWVGCVNLARNFASPSRYLDCLQFMLAPFAPGGDPFTDGDPGRAPHVLNNSWGCPEVEGCDAGALAPAVAAFRTAGIFFVASAGNTGPRCGSLQDPPARYPAAFAVAAVDERGRVTDFSSRGLGATGPQPDVAAPGAQVLSAFPGDRYVRLDGTSMAGPHVAGAVALLWSAVPSLVGDIEGTERVLRETAKPVIGRNPCGATAAAGAGIVDAYAAIRAARSPA